MRLRNNKVLIFGGGSGIGKAIAVRFMKAGAKVMITGRTEEKLKATAEEIDSPDLYYKVFDITDIWAKDTVMTELLLMDFIQMPVSGRIILMSRFSAI